ncbi:hypothetical protein VPH35_114725 [Triticum aestivum]
MPLPVLGNLLDLGGNLHHTLARLARAHGRVMKLKLGLVTTVVVSSRDAAREAYTRYDRQLAARAVPDAANAVGNSGRSMIWLPSSDPLWKTLRGIVASPPRAACASARCATWWATSAATRGRRWTSAMPWLASLGGARYQKVFGILDGIIDRRLADGRTSTGEHARGDFLDSLLELVSAGKIGRDKVTVILFDVFAAGTDTMAITVEWAIAELLRHPHAMAKVRAEMADILGGKDTDALEEPDAASLPYLQAVVKEVMRLHPVAPIMLPHQAAEDGVEIGGCAVPRGATVIFNAWAIMRDPAAWERPDEFVPERFVLDKAADRAVEFRGKDYEFIPLGSGRRLCPGLPMAERVVLFVLASLLHAFEWRLLHGVLADELDVAEKFTTVNTLAVPLRAVPVVVT